MPLLLDTCTLLWLSSDQSQLSLNAKEAIQRHAGDLFVSAISALECAVKVSKKKLQLPLSKMETWFREVLNQHGIIQVPINFQIASQSGELPLHHKDPYDRLIAATALEYKMTIVTPDELIRQYKGVSCVW
jgi:PIN domain nuclease of toxin-antitoxin system